MIAWAKNNKANMGLLAVALVMPLFFESPYILHMLVMIALYVSLASSLNLILGYTGLFSLAHAAFFGIGAYTTALLTTKMFHLPIWAGILSSGFVAAFFGMLIGLPSLKLRGDYLAICTLGFGQVVRLFELNAVKVTGGAMGIPGIPKPKVFGSVLTRIGFYYLALVVAVLVIVAIGKVVRSRIGRALMAIREDQQAAEACGVDTTYYKVLAFSMGAFFAGLAGSIYAHYITFISPDAFAFNDSILMFCMVILGGLGTRLGPVVGAALLVALPEAARFAAQYRFLIVGLVLVICMVYRPQGLLGSYASAAEGSPKSGGKPKPQAGGAVRG
ncbi:MAG: branched-chain amino acid ABC transporter permease [Ignavibacteriales bacterium]